MPKGDIDTYFENGEWKNRVEGTPEPVYVSATKADAEAKGRALAMEHGVEHIIRNKDGQIAERNTYSRSRDPRRSHG